MGCQMCSSCSEPDKPRAARRDDAPERIEHVLPPAKAPTDTESTTAGCSHASSPKYPQKTWMSTTPSLAGDVVLGRYSFSAGGSKKVLGEGSSSVCYLGIDVESGESVAIKEYKSGVHKSNQNKLLERFKREVSVLLELNEPFSPPADTMLWSRELASITPSDVFVRLLDYSKEANGEPGRDPSDGSMYIVTELAQHTLRSELKQRKEKRQPLSLDEVRKYAKDIVIAVAAMHAKGYVHLDIKPENIMMCGGRWKLIDMDGCIRAGSAICSRDHSVCFSACYCAPEFARFVVGGGSIIACPSLDVWSVGMTVGELLWMQPMMRARYYKMVDKHGERSAGYHFLKGLGNLSELPKIPRKLADHDSGRFLDFVEKWLLVVNKPDRRTLARCLSDPFLAVQLAD